MQPIPQDSKTVRQAYSCSLPSPGLCQELAHHFSTVAGSRFSKDYLTARDLLPNMATSEANLVSRFPAC